MQILSSLLSQKISRAKDRQSDFERVYWFSQIMRWIQRPRGSEEQKTKKENVYSVRIKYLISMLEKNPEWKENFVWTVSQLLMKISSADQLSGSGFSEANSFIQEFMHRLQEKMIPKPPLSEDLSTLIYEIFPNPEEGIYIDCIDPQVLGEFFNLFMDHHDLVGKLKADLLCACYILSHEVLTQSLLIQKKLNSLSSHPQHLHEFILEGNLRSQLLTHETMISDELLAEINLIEDHTIRLYELMKKHGVQIELVYLFQIQNRKTNRLKILMQFLNPQISTALNFRYFISHLILETQHQKSLRSFFSENLGLLTDRIIQANSQIGEHYVTFTWSEFKLMFKSAVGGGGITVITVFLKYFITQLNLVGFIKGFVEGLNYSSSFLLIQYFGFTLATKQPSTTAPFIASALQKSTTEARKSIVALLRTQFIAVIGNLSLVFPLCFLISWVFNEMGHPLISSTDSVQIFSSSNILGPSALFATFTGFLLFLASLIAGWFENWILVSRLDKRIKYNNKLQRYFGRANIQKFSEYLSTHGNPLAANISLGFLLGLAPQFMKFLGIPLEVRHITLSTGAFATSLPQILEMGMDRWQMLNAVAGLFAIGLLNISVSFILALLLVSVSSKVKLNSLWRLIKWGLHLIFTRPWLLIVPEKTKVKSAHIPTHQ